MMIERQRLANALAAHDLEAHGIRKTKPLVAESSKPPLGSLGFQIPVNGNDAIEGVGVNSVEQRASGGRTTISYNDYVHLGHDEIARDE